jgi:hypothetical protein
MDPLIFAVIASVALFACICLRFRKPAVEQQRKRKARALSALDTVAAWPPQATRVMTSGECKAWSVLRTALPEHIILAQVPLSRFMKVPTRNSYSEWLRRVGMISADLVVCDAQSQVIAVVDVRAADGKEHGRAHHRHARMDRVIAAAGIPMHIWHENTIPTPAVARELVLSKLAGAVNADAVAAPPSPQLDEPVQANVAPDGELARRDPPPSTWFDHLDSGAVPLGNVPAASPGPANAASAQNA